MEGKVPSDQKGLPRQRCSLFPEGLWYRTLQSLQAGGSYVAHTLISTAGWPDKQFKCKSESQKLLFDFLRTLRQVFLKAPVPRE